MRTIAFLCAMAASLTVGAHTNEILSKRAGPHGGQLRVAQQYHVELALSMGEVAVWVTDHADNPQATDGASAQAIVHYDRERVVVTLKPGGDNRLSARDRRLRADPNARIVLNLAMAGQAPVQARFAPMAPTPKPAPAATGHAH